MEACWKAVAVGLYRGLRPKQPGEFWIKWTETSEGEWRRDPEILRDMWSLVGKVRRFLEEHGFVVRFAQSTYERKADNTDSHCLDLTLKRNGNTYWLECKFCDPENFSDAVKKAKETVRDVWEVVADNADAWRLNKHLGGGPCLPPQGFGHVVFTCDKLEVFAKGVEDFFHSGYFSAAPQTQVTQQAAPKKPPKKPRPYTEARSQQNRQSKNKKGRKERRERKETMPAALAPQRAGLERAVLKRPASVLATAHRVARRPGNRTI